MIWHDWGTRLDCDNIAYLYGVISRYIYVFPEAFGRWWRSTVWLGVCHCDQSLILALFRSQNHVVYLLTYPQEQEFEVSIVAASSSRMTRTWEITKRPQTRRWRWIYCTFIGCYGFARLLITSRKGLLYMQYPSHDTNLPLWPAKQLMLGIAVIFSCTYTAHIILQNISQSSLVPFLCHSTIQENKTQRASNPLRTQSQWKGKLVSIPISIHNTCWFFPLLTGSPVAQLLSRI